MVQSSPEEEPLISKWYSRDESQITVLPPYMPPDMKYDAEIAIKLPQVAPLTVTKDDEDAVEYIRSFFRKNGRLPRLPSQRDAKRSMTVQRFNLENPIMWVNVERCARLASVFFKTPIIVTVMGQEAFIVVASINHAAQVGQPVTYDSTICSHTLNRKTPLHIPDAHDDWRFSNISHLPRSYIGQPLFLPTPDGQDQVPFGVLCLLDDENPTPSLTDEDRSVLADLGNMISNQIKHTWQRLQQEKEERMRDFLATLLTRAVASHSHYSHQSLSMSEQAHTMAVKEMCALLESDFVCVLDLTGIHPTSVPGELFGTPRPRLGKNIKEGRGSQWVRVLSAERSEKCDGYDVDAAFESSDSFAIILECLRRHVKSPKQSFTDIAKETQFSTLLPRGTQSFIAVPLFHGTQPTLLTIVATQTPHRMYEPSEISFISNITVICLSSLVQQRVLEADAAKTAFVSMISHELRTPLHGLLSQLELIRESDIVGTGTQIDGLLDTAECCGLALRDVLNDVLDFGKMEMAEDDDGGSTSLRMKHYSLVDLSGLVSDIMNVSFGRRRQWQSLNEANENAEVDVVVAVEELPMGWWVHADVPGLRRVLLNLASNALKYTPQGSIKLQLREFETQQEGYGLVEFMMQDTGVGMSEEFKHNLFTPFSQENTFNPGSGLGMSITERIVHRMGGEIDVVSELGVGTTVIITLMLQFVHQGPRRTGEASEFKIEHIVEKRKPIRTAIPKEVVRQEEDRAGARVLVVDDNQIGRKILTTVLTRRGVEFAEAVDGEHALSVFRRFKPHLVWTDVSMPVMDGIESAKRMRAIEEEMGLKKCRIVAITGLSRGEMKGALKREPALDEWLVKGQTNLKTLTAGLEDVQKMLSQTLH